MEKELEKELRWPLSYASGYLDLGMIDEAREELDALPAVFQTHRDVLRTRCRVAMVSRSWEEVIRWSEQGMDTHPGEGEFYIHAALASFRINAPATSLQYWMAAPENVRDSGFFYYNLARCEIKMGQSQDAEKHLQEALRRDPDLIGIMEGDPTIQECMEEASKRLVQSPVED